MVAAATVRPGRPRSRAVDEAIADACRSLLIEVGYTNLTIDGVAERAGVSRPSIYRRWPSKPVMLWDLLFTTPEDQVVIPHTADLRADVRFWVAQTIDFFARPEIVSAFTGLLTEQPIAAAQQARLREPVKARVDDRLHAAVADGTLRPDTDVDAIFDMVTGFAIYRAAVPQPKGKAPTADAITDQLLDGVVTRRRPRSSP